MTTTTLDHSLRIVVYGSTFDTLSHINHYFDGICSRNSNKLFTVIIRYLGFCRWCLFGTVHRSMRRWNRAKRKTERNFGSAEDILSRGRYSPDPRGASRCRNRSRNACNACTYTSRPLVVPVTYEVRTVAYAARHLRTYVHRYVCTTSDFRVCDVVGRTTRARAATCTYVFQRFARRGVHRRRQKPR